MLSIPTAPNPSYYKGDGPIGDDSKVNDNIWRAAHDAMDCLRGTGFMAAFHVDDQSSARVVDLVKADMQREAQRVFPPRWSGTVDQNGLDRWILLEIAMGHAVGVINGSQERNPAVVARTAVEVAFDRVFRFKVAAAIVTPAPTVWDWKGTGQRCYPCPDGFNLPIRVRDLDQLRINTDKYDLKFVANYSSTEPYCGLTLTYPWAMDPLRPPVAAVRTAASIIDNAVERGRFRQILLAEQDKPTLLGVDLGHSVAAQALSVFLPEFRVFTTSQFHGPCNIADNRPAQFDAVVVNVPGPAAGAFVWDNVQRHLQNLPTMNRKENDVYWNWSTPNDGKDCVRAVQYGIDKLKPGGVLVLLTDVASGQFHVAKDAIGDQLQQVDVDPDRRLPHASFGYDSKVWGVYGCVRPTERILTVWRHVDGAPV